MTAEPEHVDVVVVGGGAAGLSAALVLSRARRDVVVVDAGSPRNAPAAHAHGYLGREGVEPLELLRLGREEVRAYGGRVETGVVDAVVHGPGGASWRYEVRCVDGRSWRCRALLVCTGLSDELPGVPGLRQRWGRDVLHCPYCHGREVADRRVGVLATSPGSFHQAELVRQWCADVVLLAHGLAVGEEQRRRLDVLGVDVVEQPVDRLLVTDDALRGVRLSDGSDVGVEALFVGPVFRGTDTFLLGLGASTQRRSEGSWVVVDDRGRTSVPWLYAAGNVVDPAAQVVDAASAGSRAAVTVNGDLVDADVEAALARR
ncbi:NAD(P)/FAD-dependent oxidoreductase [Aquipuribacter nitratireducens]|uniref:NAD(P)/FAD-dependent oxidoreductase n=1 Tax=Aquipuribacter nitratireducens TaxID=650104 RepID=A0ABW0GHP0_9MICO